MSAPQEIQPKASSPLRAGKPQFRPQITLGGPQIPSKPSTITSATRGQAHGRLKAFSSESWEDSSSNLGDSSSLFSSPSAFVAETSPRIPALTGTDGQSLSSNLSKMVVEREPPRSPQKLASTYGPSQSQVPAPVTQDKPPPPAFGQPSPLRNPLKPQHHNVFNIPKHNKPRPEHHREIHISSHRDPPNYHHPQPIMPAPNAMYPSRPELTTQNPQYYEFPKPSNPPTFNTYAKPTPTFTAVNTATVNPSDGAKSLAGAPFIDLTRLEGNTNVYHPQLPSRTHVYEPVTYMSSEKAMDDIKNLLEGSIGTEKKIRKKQRKDKNASAAEGLAEQLDHMNFGVQETAKTQDEEESEDESDAGVIEGLAVRLLLHQIEGVDWMRHQEHGWEDKKDIAPKGGILADDMGLGKTIQSIALILANGPSASATEPIGGSTNSEQSKRPTLIVAPLALIKQWEAEIKSKVCESHRLKLYLHHGPSRYKRAIDLERKDVIITTYQVLVSEYGAASSTEGGLAPGCFGVKWHRVILDEAHSIKNRKAKATIAACALNAEYRWCLTGTPMQNNLDELQSLIAFLRVKPFNDFSIWKREIAQPINQGKGQLAMKRLQVYLKAIMKRRTKEILKQDGALNNKKSNGDVQGFKIVGRKIETVAAEFGPQERQFYQRLEQSTGRSLDIMLGRNKINYAGALVLLLRLRQACNHPDLVKTNLSNDKDALSTGQPNTSPRKQATSANEMDTMASLLDGLSVENKRCDVCQIDLTDEEISSRMIRCTECQDNLATQGVVVCKTPEHHSGSIQDKKKQKGSSLKNKGSFVVHDTDEEEGSEDGEWIVPKSDWPSQNFSEAGGTDDENAEGGGKSLASTDTETGDESELQVLGSRELHVTNPKEPDVEAAIRSFATTTISDSADISTSAKIAHLLPILHRETGQHKVIVFSQFTSMLNLIEPHLHAEALPFARYDGSMRNDLREASLERLRNDESCRILLCSLKCGSLGLNLTAASRVVVLEPFWNPFVEEQAIDRVHRINQTKDVVVYKLTVKGTVEERILALQERKRALANAAIEGKDKAGRLDMKDLLKLFNHNAVSDWDKQELSIAPAQGVPGNPLHQAAAFMERFRPSERIPQSSVQKNRGPIKEDAVYGRRW